jgi:hypothetical protein
MAIEFTCPGCGSGLLVEDDSAGRMIRCGQCLTMLRVPETAATPDRQDGEDRRFDAESEEEDRSSWPLRRRSPPSGRGPLYWIALVGGILGLGCCCSCGLVALLVPGAKWRSHHSEKGGFEVELPAAPRDNLPIPGFRPDPEMKIEGAVLWVRGEAYVVAYNDLPARAARGRTDEQLLAESVKSLENDPECRRILRNEPVHVSGFPGREVEFRGRDGGTYTVMLVVAERRFYAVIAGGRFVRPGNSNIKRFLQSFKITDEAPRGAAGKGK